MNKQAFLVLALAAVAFAELELGTCPEFTNIETFDIPPYLGRWFEIERFETGFQLDMECVTADYGPLSDTSITVVNTANILGQLINIEGTGTATGVTGQLIVEFPGNDPGFYNVLDTDYETYSCVYSCSQVGEYMQQYAWVLSRTMTMDDATLATAEEKFSTFGIDLTKFRTTIQGGDCIYAPEAP